MVLETHVDPPVWGTQWVDTLMWSAAGLWTIFGDVVHFVLAPFVSTQEEPDACDMFGEDEEDEGSEASEAAHTQTEQEVWMQSALLIAARIVNDQTSDAATLKQHYQELFELMVSMGILEFATQGYKFKLHPHICVTPIVP